MFHSFDFSYGFAMPMGGFKGGHTEDLSGGNALSGSAFNMTIHDEVKEFFGGVIKFGYRQHNRQKQADHDYFSNVGSVEIYGDKYWRINHLAIGPQIITPVTSTINADVYVLLGVQWGYVPELEMVYYGSHYSVQDYYTYSPFICPSGILGGDVRMQVVGALSFVVNAEFILSKPKIEYTEIYTHNGSAQETHTVEQKGSLPIDILSISGGVSLAF
jgi:hypothetical protein